MKLVYKELSYQLNGICYKVHNKLSRFCKEKQYADALEQLLKASPIAYKREHEVSFDVDGKAVKGNRVDFLIDGKVILEVKAKPLITKEDYFQVRRYLQAGGFQLGLIVNFRNVYLKPKRVLNSSVIEEHS